MFYYELMSFPGQMAKLIVSRGDRSLLRGAMRMAVVRGWTPSGGFDADAGIECDTKTLLAAPHSRGHTYRMLCFVCHIQAMLNNIMA